MSEIQPVRKCFMPEEKWGGVAGKAKLPPGKRENSPVCHRPATKCSQGSRFISGMKIHVCDEDLSWTPRRGTPRKAAPRTVTHILRAAYRRHTRDLHTRQALKRCLR